MHCGGGEEPGGDAGEGCAQDRRQQVGRTESGWGEPGLQGPGGSQVTEILSQGARTALATFHKTGQVKRQKFILPQPWRLQSELKGSAGSFWGPGWGQLGAQGLGLELGLPWSTAEAPTSGA